MSEFTEKIDKMNEQLENAKQILQEESLQSYLTYYELKLHEKELLNDITGKVNESCYKELSDLFDEIHCKVQFDEESFEEYKEVIFNLSWSHIERLAAIDVEEKIIFLQAKSVATYLEGRSVEHLEHYMELVTQMDNLVSEFGFHLKF